MQRDPIGYYDSMNLYKYVFNSPSNYIDPYGLISVSLGDGKTLSITDFKPWSANFGLNGGWYLDGGWLSDPSRIAYSIGGKVEWKPDGMHFKGGCDISLHDPDGGSLGLAAEGVAVVVRRNGKNTHFQGKIEQINLYRDGRNLLKAPARQSQFKPKPGPPPPGPPQRDEPNVTWSRMVP